jgi:hypothetical protein
MKAFAMPSIDRHSSKDGSFARVGALVAGLKLARDSHIDYLRMHRLSSLLSKSRQQQQEQQQLKLPSCIFLPKHRYRSYC